MPYTQEFILGNSWLGQSRRIPAWVHEQAAAPDSLAMFCPVCGEVWARFPVLINATGKYVPFHVLTRNCWKHASEFLLNVPGSAWLSWDREFTNAFPREMLERELLLHLDHFHPEEKETL